MTYKKQRLYIAFENEYLAYGVPLKANRRYDPVLTTSKYHAWKKSKLFELLEYIEKFFVDKMEKLIDEGYIVQKRGKGDRKWYDPTCQVVPVKCLDIVKPVKRMVSPDEGLLNPYFRLKLGFLDERGRLEDVRRFRGTPFLQGARFEDRTLNEDNCHLLVEGCLLSGLLCMESVCASSVGLSIPMKVLSLDAKLPFK